VETLYKYHGNKKTVLTFFFFENILKKVHIKNVVSFSTLQPSYATYLEYKIQKIGMF